MLRNEKLFPTLSSLYLHDNQSSHLIPHAEESLPSVLHPEIIDKPYPPSNQKKRKNRERLSSGKRKKESSIQKPSSSRKSPPRVLEEQPDQTLQAWPTSRPSFRIGIRVREPRAPHTWSRNTGEGARESAKPRLERAGR